MRQRLLDPGFFRNAHLARLSPHARLLFAALWCMADRKGRCEAAKRAVLGTAFPYDDTLDEHQIGRLLDELEAPPGAFIRRYEVDGRCLLWIPSFLKFQHPHKREKPSVLPPHPEDVEPRHEEGRPDPGLRLVPDRAEPRKGRGSARRNTVVVRKDPSSSSPTENKPSGAAAAESDRNWLAPYLAVWEELRGGRMPNAGQAAGALRPVDVRYGRERALAGWRKYLATRDGREASPVWFAGSAASWCGPPPLPEEANGSLRGWVKPHDWPEDQPAWSWPCTCDAQQHAAYDRALRGTCPLTLGLRVDSYGRVVAA